MDSTKQTIKQELTFLGDCVNNSMPNSSSKRKRNTDISNYQRKQILAHLQSNGCTKDEFFNIVTKYKTNYQDICEHFNNCIRDAEEYVHEECDAPPFTKINQWLELLKSARVNEHCCYEAAAVINSIANNEPHPPKNELDGIDLKELYTFLGKALLGQPQNELNAPSSLFLAKELQLLIEEVNGDDYDSVLLQQAICENAGKNAFNYDKQPHKCSFDPFMVDDVVE